MIFRGSASFRGTITFTAKWVIELETLPSSTSQGSLTIAAELGDARRFPSARGVMAYVGLIPSEHSSGTKRARGAITKTGNAHVRRVLVEAAWHYRHHPFIGKQLRRRPTRGARAGADPCVAHNSASIVGTIAWPPAGNPNNMSSPPSPAS